MPISITLYYNVNIEYTNTEHNDAAEQNNTYIHIKSDIRILYLLVVIVVVNLLVMPFFPCIVAIIRSALIPYARLLYPSYMSSLRAADAENSVVRQRILY